MIERPTFREISDCLETKWDFMNVRYITWRGEWRSRHLCLSGYKLEPARRSEVHRDSRERRRGEPQTANPVANGPARGWARGGVVVVVELGRRGWGVGWRGGEEGEREWVIYSCEWVCCPQGLLWRVSKGKGATKTGFSHLNKRMEMEMEMEPGEMIMQGRKWEAKAQLLCSFGGEGG